VLSWLLSAAPVVDIWNWWMTLANISALHLCRPVVVVGSQKSSNRLEKEEEKWFDILFTICYYTAIQLWAIPNIKLANYGLAAAAAAAENIITSLKKGWTLIQKAHAFIYLYGEPRAVCYRRDQTGNVRIYIGVVVVHGVCIVCSMCREWWAILLSVSNGGFMMMVMTFFYFILFYF
jgi:hypothetical protein